MLRVTVEMLPFGDEAAKRTLGTLYIANTRSSPKSLRADYTVTTERGGEVVASVQGFWRKRGFWHLVFEALYEWLDMWEVYRFE